MRAYAPPRVMVRGGTSNDQLRRLNLSMVLTMVHHSPGCSRAELTKRTGLTRSTIAALVGELSDLGLVREGSPESAVGRVGRPSPQVFPNPGVAAIAVNPDVDAITVGLVSLGGEVVRRVRLDTTHVPSVAETVRVVRQAVAGIRREVGSDYLITGLGAAIPGLVRTDDGRVLLAPHLGWRDAAFTQPLAKALHSDGFHGAVFAGNDASLGAVAECLFGVGQRVNDVVYVNGSASGIGGGLIVNGAPLRGASGFAGELGHAVVNPAGRRCHCGRIGCLETEVNLGSLLRVLGLSRADGDELDVALSINRDAVVRREIDRQVDWLAAALANVVNVFDPELVILGGFLGSLLSVSGGALAERIAAQSIARQGRGVRVLRASLRSKLLLVGAAELAFAAVLDDPGGFVRGLT